MKKLPLILAAVAGMTVTSCTTNDFVGEATQQTVGDGSIQFSGGAGALARADLYGSAAADKLSNTFVVYGTKHAAAEDATATNDAVVFNNFQVGYAASTAGTTASNSSDWEYVGKAAYSNTVSSQGIKYWDYSADKGYTFYAFSSSNITYPAKASNKVSVTKVTSDATSLYNKGYEVTVKAGANLNNLYFSDRVEVAEANYDKTVDFTFRNIGAKVRVGFYETIPGYTVKIDKFYIDDAAAAPVTTFPAMNDAKTDGFYASLQNVSTSTNQTLNVTYYDESDPIVKNRPRTSNPTSYAYSLKVGDGSSIIDQTLGTAANAPTWAVAAGAYTPVFAFETNTNPMLVKLDFTLTADDGSSDVIHVRGARAIVPAEYVKWKSNFAYTYIFKISDKTNGTTGAVDANDEPTDPEGLKAITFDAIVVDIANEYQETLTTVSTNSVTTYAKGQIADEYATGEPIYVAVTNNAATPAVVLTPSAIGAAAGNAQVYKLSAAASEAEVLAELNGSPMPFTMTALTTPVATIETTVPLSDGTTPAISNVKFTPSAAGTYAYVYTTTAYVAPTYTAVGSDAYDSSKTYYMLSGSGAYFAVSVPTQAAFDANKASLYKQTATGTPGVYDVKVIKVQ